MIKSIAQEYAKRNVTANCVAPGFIVTPMTEKLNDKQREAILAKIPASRPAPADEVAAAVAFLASERGRLRHRTDVACQWRNGHDLKAITDSTPDRCAGALVNALKYGNRTAIGLGEPEGRSAGHEYPPLIGVDPRPPPTTRPTKL